MTRKRLAIIGASSRAAVWSATRGGYDCIAFDMFADADLRELCPVTKIEQFDDRLLDLLSAAEVDAWMYTGGMENHHALVGKLAKAKPLLGCGEEVLAKVRDPWWLAGILTEAGHAFPEIREIPPADGPGPWLVKHRKSCGGLGVKRHALDSTSTAAESWDRYYQRYIDGKPISAMYLAADGECHLIATFEQLIGVPWTGVPSEFMYCGAIGPLDFGDGVDRQLEEIGWLLTRAAGLQGPFGIDAILSNDRLSVLEFNPRYTASMELWERHAAESAIKRWTSPVSAASPKKSNGVFAKVIAFAREEYRIGTRGNAFRSERDMADIPIDGQCIGVGEPICTLFSRGRDKDESLRQLKARVTQLRNDFSRWSKLNQRLKS